jgi:hypothetical protein
LMIFDACVGTLITFLSRFSRARSMPMMPLFPDIGPGAHNAVHLESWTPIADRTSGSSFATSKHTSLRCQDNLIWSEFVGILNLFKAVKMIAEWSMESHWLRGLPLRRALKHEAGVLKRSGMFFDPIQRASLSSNGRRLLYVETSTKCARRRTFSWCA